MSSQLLNELFATFNRNEEALNFLVTPPANAGSAFMSKEPFFYFKDERYSTNKPSAELAILIGSLASALMNYIAIESKGKPVAMLTDKPMKIGDYEVIFIHWTAGSQGTWPQFGAGYGMGGGYGTYGQFPNEMVVKTPRGIFPVCGSNELNQACIRHNGSVFGGVVFAGTHFQQGNAGQGWTAPSIDPLYVDQGTPVLAGIFNSLLDARCGKETDAAKQLVRAYIERSYQGDEEGEGHTAVDAEVMAQEELQLMKEMAQPQMNWKQFLKMLSVLNMAHCKMQFELVGLDGRKFSPGAQFQIH